MTLHRARKAHRGTLGTKMRQYRNVDVRWCNPSQNKKVTSARSGKHLTEIIVAPIRWRRYFVQHSTAVLDVNKG